MTTQSDWQHASSQADEADDDTTIPDSADASARASDESAALDTDPDLIVVSSDDSDLDDGDLDSADGEDLALDHNIVAGDVVTGTVIPDSGDTETGPADAGLITAAATTGDTAAGDTAEVDTTAGDTADEDAARAVPAAAAAVAGSVVPAGPGPAVSSASSAGLGPQWHDIQAQFVDDPRGSVQLAAAAVDEAVTELLETLNQRRAGLVPADGTPGDPESTEQLREALRSCRMFCENLADISQRFASPAVLAR